MSMTRKAIYSKLLTAPGAVSSGKYRDETLRKNATDTAATVRFFETDTAKNLTGLSISISDGDLLSTGDVPSTGSPSATSVGTSYLATR